MPSAATGPPKHRPLVTPAAFAYLASSNCVILLLLLPLPPVPGYQTVYKGKFHLTKPSDPSGEWTQSDLASYGFARWNPPDAGADQSLPEGGGNPLGGGNNDVR